MGRFFENRRALAMKGNDNGGVMSEQEDILSEYASGDSDNEQSLISVMKGDEDLYRNIEIGGNGKTAVAKSDVGDDEDSSDVVSESDSDSDSAEYYDSNRQLDADDESDEYEDLADGKQDDATDCSRTSVSDPLGGDSSRSKYKETKGSKKANFFGRIFGGKKKRERDESNKSKNIVYNNNEDGDIEPSEKQNFDRSHSESPSFSVHVFEDRSERVSNDGSNDDDVEVPLADPDSATNDNRSKRNYSGHRVKYVAPKPGMTEEGKMSKSKDDEDYRTYSAPMKEDKKNFSSNSGHVKKKVDEINNFNKEVLNKNKDAPVHDGAELKSFDAPHNEPPDPDDDDSVPDSPKGTTKKPKSTTKGKKRGKKPHPSAAAARSHGGLLSSRIDYTGHISSAPAPVSVTPAAPVIRTDKLQNEVYRLRSLVDLMMTRMEFYERQSDFLLEATEDHSQAWKLAAVDKKRAKKSRVDEKLSDIKDLLMERSAQDKWIRQLEGVQRGYEQRLSMTHKQLQQLRSEHIITNKKIKDMKKDKTSWADSGKTELTPETVSESRSTKNHEAMTPVSNNIALARWTGEGGAPNSPTAVKIVRNGSKLDDTNGSGSRVTAMDPEGRKIATLLEEMIVSWHSTGSELSPLSDKRDKKKKKKDKKKKKKKKEKYTGEIL